VNDHPFEKKSENNIRTAENSKSGSKLTFDGTHVLSNGRISNGVSTS
jgi:hypothetical protein